MDAFLVVNPRSAGGRTGTDWPRVARKLEAAGLQVKARFTEGPGHATELTREGLRDGHQRIVAVGGDGTINEVVNGFFEADGRSLNPEAALGVLCRGTGCDFIKTHGIPKQEDAAIQRLATATPRSIDIGRVEHLDALGQRSIRYFCNIAEAGMGGAAVRRVNSGSKRLGGFASFLIGTLQTFATYQNHPMTLQLDDHPPESLVGCDVIIGIGRYFGGGMCVLPQAQPDDGVFDILILGDLSRFELFANVARVYFGTHLSHPKVRHLQARRVKVSSSAPLLLETDGEQPGVTPATFTLLPGALKLLA